MGTVAPAAGTARAQSASPDGMVVHIEGLTKRFRERLPWLETIRHPSRRHLLTALNRVTFGVRSGEFFGLLGPNGAGKTTLFKILCTVILPDEGTARVDGLDIRSDADGVRGKLAAVIADERSLMWRLSARENLRLYAALYGIPARVRQRRIDELLQVVELVEAGERMVAKYSSGMKQRLLIARALLPLPRVLLLDEPTRSLDPLAARRFRAFLREEIAGRQGCTVILATHNAEEARELCDRVAVLHRGQVLAVGGIDQLSGEVADDRYQIWTGVRHRRELLNLAGRNRARVLDAGEDSGEAWVPVEIELAGGDEAGARFLAQLAAAGVPVARFERMPLSLADLIERIVARSERRGHE